MNQPTDTPRHAPHGLPQDLDELLRRAANPADGPDTAAAAQAPAPANPVPPTAGTAAPDGTSPGTARTATPDTAPPDAADEDADKRFSWKSILVGDILTHDILRRQTGLLVMLVIYSIIYISNRYNVQQQMIEIDRLKKELTDIKYDALTRSSELTEKSRQSRIEDYVSQEESEIQTSTNPPYLIE